MGAQASKQVTRKLPRTAQPETLKSTPRESPSTLQSAQQNSRSSDTTKDDILEVEIEQERSNPQLLENLAKLGPVTIPPTITRMRQSDAMLGILHERKRMERMEANDNQRSNNRITTDELFSILEHRKHLPPKALEEQPETWQKISKESGGVDITALKTLFKYYNTVTVMPPMNPEDKEERRLGLWVENKEEWKQRVDETHKRYQEQQAKEDARRDIDQQQKSTEQSQTQEERRQRQLRDLFSDHD
ncbi:uncharacterized protein BX664DRAFT_326762 [Halteromyces radiatus]|uniref:uncharacterized protein n=1 Tax=Halteromyces radiatus TaxID=101107 RepID=UPI00221FCCCF|nr:uncharacterized protein BX664DRAFT_326762 [Halteromyces radiatus]KAI8097593.1 hypothetical protein BX664DRAFT_326762 [Halteromyces radiatus]